MISSRVKEMILVTAYASNDNDSKNNQFLILSELYDKMPHPSPNNMAYHWKVKHIISSNFT